MSVFDLKSEFESAVARLDRTRIPLPGDLPVYISGIGLQAIEPDGDFYQPTDRGPLALIIPVYDGPMPCFLRPVDEIPELIDLVAFRLTEPRRWWRRTDLADYLGEHRIQSAVTWSKSLRVLETPLAWLCARGLGVCPLSDDFSALRCVPVLQFEDTVFATRVERELAHPFPIPRILVRNIAA